MNPVQNAVPRSVRLVFAILSAVAATAALLAACGHKPSARATAPPAQADTVADVRTLDRTLTADEAHQYAGDAACTACHPRECRDHAASAHAQTLQAVTLASYGKRFRSGLMVRDTASSRDYATTVVEERCVETWRRGSDVGAAPADLAVGSASAGQTYLGRVAPGRWLDLRVSYYPTASVAGRWDFTPRQGPGEHPGANPAGQEMDAQRLANCLACHTTYLVSGADEPDLDASHFGVGCERCHGPALAHVESARRPTGSGTFEHLEDLHTAPRPRLMAICGRCHSTESDPRRGDPVTESGLPRFQTTALERSRCYTSSPALTCVTCHDSHAGLSRSPARYDAVCLHCHSGRSGAGTPHTACRVNPTSGCTGCHMPAQHIATIRHSSYHTHWVKVWRTGRPS